MRSGRGGINAETVGDHNRRMRMTITLDDDVADIATRYAKSRDKTLSKAIGELISRGLRKTARIKFVNGLPVFDLSKEKQPITTERVKAFEAARGQ